jgi:prolyl oligopeptidase
MLSGAEQLGFLVFHYLEKTLTDFYVWPIGQDRSPELVIQSAEYKFGPCLLKDGRILAITDREAPNSKIVEVRPLPGREPEYVDVVPESESVIQSWTVAGERIFVSYFRNLKTEVAIFDLSGRRLRQLPVEETDTVRLLSSSDVKDELLFELESFTKPMKVCHYSPKTGEIRLWANRAVPFDATDFGHIQVWFAAKDGMQIPMFLVGRRDVLNGGPHPAVMTAYGGYGCSMTPQFSVFVAQLMERGCLFALPNIRGGSEFGAEWHRAAKRRHRQVAIDDFLSAAQWLIGNERTVARRLAVFGGSNSGLLVGAALTQRPDLFRAVLCMVPMLDMLRYHLFDNAHIWKEEFGTSDDADDFAALLRYSPYHNVRDGAAYPATMIVSGDRDQNCNPLHARKMTARLQASSTSQQPIFLDYSQHRGHSPVLPLSERVDALTDRMAFLCEQLQLPV